MHFEFTPYYGQLHIMLPGATEIPQFTTGKESAVGNTAGVVVATRGDADGDVTVDIPVSAEDLNSLHLIYEAGINLPTGELEVGSIVGGDTKLLDVGVEGNVTISVYVDNPGMASSVHVDIS